MSDEPRLAASPTYALGQLWRALDRAQGEGDPAARKRAEAKAERWQAVLSGMATGELTVGSRTPVADTPPWVTLEVVHGGFATGRYLAEAPLDADEIARLSSLPPDSPGTTERERLNLWYLSDAGQAELLSALGDERYRVDVPEAAALLVVAWLVDRGSAETALDLVSELRPLMHRLRFTPKFTAFPRPAGAAVRLQSVSEVAAPLRDAQMPLPIRVMRETLQIWHPLYDRLVTLWSDTVTGELPGLTEDSTGQITVTGGWPCQTWPADWADRRRHWLEDFVAADAAYRAGGRHRHSKSNFSRLRIALERCEGNTPLPPRELGWVRRALANTITKHGAPGMEARAALRATQAAISAQPAHADVAHVVAGRLDRYPSDGGIPALDPLAVDVGSEEADGVPPGTPIPQHIVRKVTRALEAPIEELVERGVITSGEVLARVLPQVSSQLMANNIADPDLAALYAQTYAAFRRRRSLLLLNLEHQVRFEELPWVAALDRFRAPTEDARRVARQTLTQTTLLALSALPHAILPNPLVREMGALAGQADIKVPLVEEVAADIFMGTFTTKWRRAAHNASTALEDTLYARYYDLPPPGMWTETSPPRSARRVPWRRGERWGKETAEDFAQMCRARAAEAASSSSGKANYVAQNGAVLEQSQILTTHNLAQLTESLMLGERLQQMAPELADRTLEWVVRRQAQPWNEWRATLQMLKNTAYAWRQAIFYLSFCTEDQQLAAMERIRQALPNQGPATGLRVVADGLEHVIRGGRFDANGRAVSGEGRRFLGWAVGRHWLLPEDTFATATRG